MREFEASKEKGEMMRLYYNINKQINKETINK